MVIAIKETILGTIEGAPSGSNLLPGRRMASERADAPQPSPEAAPRAMGQDVCLFRTEGCGCEKYCSSLLSFVGHESGQGDFSAVPASGGYSWTADWRGPPCHVPLPHLSP